VPQSALRSTSRFPVPVPGNEHEHAYEHAGVDEHV